MFLESLEVHHLWFTCQPETSVHFGPQAGAQIRGALWQTLQPLLSGTEFLDLLMALETPTAARGSNPARPFSVRPPVAGDPASDRRYGRGEAFCFGVSLFGSVIELFPYIVQAVHRMGLAGVGYNRGLFALVNVEVANPLTGQRESLLAEGRITGLPTLPVTADHVTAYAQALPQDRLTLRFITPTQLSGKGGKLLSHPAFDCLIARLIERVQMIADNYTAVATPPSAWRELHLNLVAQAEFVQTVAQNTRWVNVRTGSRRTNTGKKISGFVGDVTYSGPLEPFLTWIIWGQSLQVGKNTVKGDGWYELV